MEEILKKEIKKLIFENVEQLNYHLYDLEEEKNSNKHTIRLLVQKLDLTSVDLDDCVSISNRIADLLENVEELEQEYLLEVCSPGIIKNLKRPEHFEQHLNEEVEIKTFKLLEGFDSKLISGILKGVEEEYIVLDEVKISYKDIAKANNKFEF